MQNVTFIGVSVALASGLAIGVQTVFFTLIGRAVGPARAGVVINLSAGVVAAIVLAGALLIQGREPWATPRISIIHALIAAVMGLFILAGITFAYQRIGVAAGLAALFVGQMVVGAAVDALGMAGGDPIPVDPPRVLGLVVLGIGVALLAWRR